MTETPQITQPQFFASLAILQSYYQQALKRDSFEELDTLYLELERISKTMVDSLKTHREKTILSGNGWQWDNIGNVMIQGLDEGFFGKYNYTYKSQERTTVDIKKVKKFIEEEEIPANLLCSTTFTKPTLRLKEKN